jgi:hypothetical protein
MSRTLFPWIALGVGVAGVGAAAWSERGGSAAVDPAKRYRDLQRMAAPGSGATANERAMAQRLLAKMTPPPQQAPRASYRASPPGSERDFGRWASKYQPWQTDPRDSTEIYRNDLKDLNFAKKSIYEHASGPRVKATFWAFDGSYSRSVFTAFSSMDDLGYGGKVLEAWGEPYFKRDGVFDAVVVTLAEEPGQARVVRIRGRDVSGDGIVVEHESFNQNPFNDAGFASRLRRVLARDSV